MLYKGFTLIELMIVLTIAAILLTMGIPSFRTLMADNQATSTANELLYALQVARSEAVKRNLMVSLCPSSDQTTCTGSGSWHVGWIVFIDTNGNGVKDNGEQIIRVQNAFDSTITLAGPTTIQYATGGYLQSAVITSIQSSVAGSVNNKWVCLTAIGKAQVQSVAC